MAHARMGHFQSDVSIGLEPPQIRDVPKAREDLMTDRGALRFSRTA
jgi:hypothetical protein